ncbi:hypothetical protein D915_011225 [Fasciola hepatica]|uniref:RPAP1 N-terminal domain-containing protein n=1 Tax=Fasciola hepatica TaxID=6192 RepID=A0A4E0QSN5_FASHE|nr:hypothetical protein D915_011225 [Fasciola hepatica]
MFNKRIKDETELILEQEHFLRNVAGQRIVSVRSLRATEIREHKSKVPIRDETVENVPSPIFSEIKERVRVPADESNFESSSTSVSKGSFPTAEYRTTVDDAVSESKCGKTRMSVFAREMERLRPGSSSGNSQETSTSNAGFRFGGEYLEQHGPQTITGSGLGCRIQEASRIHKENINRLCSLSEAEIMAEREQILSSTSTFP